MVSMSSGREEVSGLHIEWEGRGQWSPHRVGGKRSVVSMSSRREEVSVLHVEWGERSVVSISSGREEISGLHVEWEGRDQR